MKIIEKQITEIRPYENNPRRNDDSVEVVAKSIKEFGFKVPIVITADGEIVCGHTRYKAALQLNLETVPCVIADAFRLVDNKTSELSTWDIPKLDMELYSLSDFSLKEFGFNVKDICDGESCIDENLLNDKQLERGKIKERFLFSPFSVLDTRKKEWLDRKMFWINEIGLKDSLAREATKITGSLSGSIPLYYSYKKKCEKELKTHLTNKEFEEKYLQDYLPSETIISHTESGGVLSLFDPVLAELMYYWFAFPKAKILDPFSGGIVRGAIAGLTGYEYLGVDIRQEQVAQNIEQFSQFQHEGYNPKWICGNSLEIDKIALGEYDMIFSCPPYFDLEKYSDNPDDLSNMTYDDFCKCYREIIKKSVKMLKENRFAVFVVGDIRNTKTGFYRNFVSETIAAFLEAGMNLYNEIIMVTQAGSLPIRIGGQFPNYRKTGKMHQNILVFYKGDPKKIKTEFGEVKIAINKAEEN